MNLPAGVRYDTGRERLLAKGKPAWIEIGEDAPGANHYVIKDRSFRQAVAPYLHGDWAEFDQRNKLSTEGVIYSGADYVGRPLLPNITVLPNLRLPEGVQERQPNVFGCTMGHWHPREAGRERSQEVYEFQAYGLMALDREVGEIELWVMQDGDKVAVPSGCHMTLYNLGDREHPLVTLDFANPDRNPANKELIGMRGPVLLAYYNDAQAVFRLNRAYINPPEGKAGVRLDQPPRELKEAQIRIIRDAEQDLGSQLHQQLTQNAEVAAQSARLGIRLRIGSPETTLRAKSAGGISSCRLADPLIQAVRPGSEGYRFFMGPDVAGECGA